MKKMTLNPELNNYSLLLLFLVSFFLNEKVTAEAQDSEETDLVTPVMIDGEPAAGCRVPTSSRRV